MIDRDRWVRLLLSLLAELEADGHPEPERAAVDEYMHIRRGTVARPHAPPRPALRAGLSDLP